MKLIKHQQISISKILVLLNICSLTVLVTVVTILFYTKSSVLKLSAQRAGFIKEVIVMHDEIDLLKAEISYLESPERILKLANKYLKMRFILAQQVINKENMQTRLHKDMNPKVIALNKTQQNLK